MAMQRRVLLLVIVLGGSAVLASYGLALAYEPSIRTGLWGGVPASLRPVYTVNMLLAAIGFFPTTILLGFATPLERFKERTGASFGTLLGAYVAILVPSALWLPLTAYYIQNPSSALLWWTIRVDLLVVGLGATGLGWMALRRTRGESIWLHGALPTFFFFWLQTAILDAILWPYYYHA